MAININPSFINVTPGQVGQSGIGQGQQGGSQSQAQPNAVVPSPANVNIIPSPLTLSTLINSAVSAQRSGQTWDRGTILNLLV